MTDGTFTSAYIKSVEERGLRGENLHQTRALCHIADMLTDIASDIRALRETNTRKGATE